MVENVCVLFTPVYFFLIQDSIQEGRGGEEDPGGSSPGGGSKEEKINFLSVRVTTIRKAIHIVHDYVSI